MERNPRLFIALIGAGIVLTVLTGIALYGLFTGPRTAGAGEDRTSSAAPTETDGPSAGDELLAIDREAGGEEFARSAAEALFTWSTRGQASPELVREHLLEVADPTGYETPGLYADLAGYLPSESQWRQLRQFDTRQSIKITELAIPQTWEDVVSDPANELAPGTVAFTIDAERIRSGGWEGSAHRDETRDEVEFTVFVTCPEKTGECSLLRLSKLGSALR
ncbi:hypothetical protein [Leucobacter ruminantium]|uniref:Uncharacterized protein n=1 Tax=Leucobacter ruminantium TaxID=1289170 RepID=A0A939RY40_9MICO|nr:hypothetical protein [Leucobacter ruminantium]MBO1804471.1 hypothetical protein [Leucobacter ruminantium]